VGGVIEEVLIEGASRTQLQELFQDVPGVEISDVRVGRAVLTIDNGMIQDDTLSHFIQVAGYRAAIVHQLE